LMAFGSCLSFFRAKTSISRRAPQRILKIHVRGQQFATSIQTLSKTDSPVLKDLIDQANVNSSVDLNADPQVFQYVLIFLRDGVGFMLPSNSDDVLTLLELAEDLKMPELAAVITGCTAECSEPTTMDTWPTRRCSSDKHLDGQAITHDSLAQLMGSLAFQGQSETASTFPDEGDQGSEDSESTEWSVRDSKVPHFISSDDTMQYSHRRQETPVLLDDLEKRPARRQWTVDNLRSSPATDKSAGKCTYVYR